MDKAGLDDADVDRDGTRFVLTADRPATATTLRGLTGYGRVHFRQVILAIPLHETIPAGIADVRDPPEPSVPPGRDAVVAKLGPAYEALVPSIECRQFADAPLAESGPDRSVVRCDETAKYLLAPASLTGADVASARMDLTNYGRFAVQVSFTPDGQTRFTNLTREVATVQGQIAILQDTAVVSAPTVDGPLTGDAEISGGFDRTEALLLAAQIGSGELPLRLTPTS
jgi:hypothetical protein